MNASSFTRARLCGFAEGEARGRGVELLHVERDELRRTRAEDMTLLVLLRLWSVLEPASVLRAVLLGDLRRELPVRPANDVHDGLAVRGLVTGLHAEREARIACEVARPARLV